MFATLPNMTDNETLGQVNLASENGLSTCVIAPDG